MKHKVWLGPGCNSFYTNMLRSEGIVIPYKEKNAHLRLVKIENLPGIEGVKLLIDILELVLTRMDVIIINQYRDKESMIATYRKSTHQGNCEGYSTQESDLMLDIFNRELQDTTLTKTLLYEKIMECVTTHEVVTFKHLQKLFEYLNNKTDV